MNRKLLFFLSFAVIIVSTPAFALFSGPFEIDVRIEEREGAPHIVLDFEIPEDHYLYAHEHSITLAEDMDLIEVDVPHPTRKFDPFLEKEIDVFDASVSFVYRLGETNARSATLQVEYQGCNPDVCFAPTSREFTLALTDELEAETTTAVETSETADEADELLTGFVETGRASGYMSSKAFIDFLEEVETGQFQADGAAIFAGRGILAIVLIIVLGGLALNLTPCVLPMIPVNIAILGAGSQAKSKTRGFLLGSTYGAGIAIAYGALGLIVLLTGARFGTLNASPAFNFGIALLFAVLSLAMFGVFNIDLSRFQGGAGSKMKGGRFATAFIFGIIAALLAGACVAPVVISVLLYSAALYAEGNSIAAFLPFLLGLGMALPWPFAGAGLSFLPKSGAWMDKVKYAFGIVILIAALYYARLGLKLLPASGTPADDAVAAEEADSLWLTTLEEAVAEAHETGKPIFMDFWAVWCSACMRMDRTTFRDPDVLERLSDYVMLKLDADDQRPSTQYALERFVDVGLPTYAIVELENE